MELIARDLRHLFDVGVIGSLSDGQLLDRFLACREEAIFAAIIDRHGPMVWANLPPNHHGGDVGCWTARKWHAGRESDRPITSQT